MNKESSKCTHDRYRSKDYMMYSNALKIYPRNKIGEMVINCEDCGADISHAKRVKIKITKKEKRSAKGYTIIVRGEKVAMICLNGETIEEAEETCKLKFGKNFESISE